MEVRQTIKILDAYVPESWNSAVQQAHGHLRPGTTAVTVTGTRHRSGVWNGESAESSHPVAFTVFVACEPSFDRCHRSEEHTSELQSLMRISYAVFGLQKKRNTKIHQA